MSCEHLQEQLHLLCDKNFTDYDSEAWAGLDPRMWRKFKADLSRRAFWEGFHNKLIDRRENFSETNTALLFGLQGEKNI